MRVSYNNLFYPWIIDSDDDYTILTHSCLV